MKPGDHPEFFRFAPPPGTSRESTISLDGQGRFWHDGERVESRALELALHRWVSRHPDDRRLILTNGYDWCYFKAEDTPYFITSLSVTTGPTGEPTSVDLTLSDETTEPLDVTSLALGEDGVVYVRVKGGEFEARFSRHAQTQLAPILVEERAPSVRVGGVLHTLEPREKSVSAAEPSP